MAFSQATITAVNKPLYVGGQVYISWTSSSPAGTWFQLYIDGQLSWSGRQLLAWLPIPSGPGRVDLGTVAVGEERTDFSGSLPARPKREAKLSWLGGTYEGANLAGFHVYSGTAPGGAISYAAPVAEITAYPQSVYTDGFGLGGFGLGGFGSASSSYSWTSRPLAAGAWNFGVKPFDAAGNEGAAVTTAVMITAPPRAPGDFGDQTRLHYTYSFSTKKATLVWNAGPP